jgi:hypothetical protein
LAVTPFAIEDVYLAGVGDLDVVTFQSGALNRYRSGTLNGVIPGTPVICPRYSPVLEN